MTFEYKWHTLVQNAYQAVIKNPTFFIIAVLCLGGVFAFVSLASEVLEGESRAIDTAILMWFRDPQNHELAYGPLWLHEMMRDLTALGGIIVLTFITLGVVFYMAALKKYGQALYIACAVGSGVLLSNLLKIGFDRPRPDLVPHNSITYMASFPSGHSLMAAVVYLTLGVLLVETQKSIRIKIYILGFMIFLAVIIGISRLYLGVHWPSDVLAGWLAGGAWALLAWLINQRIKMKYFNP